MKLKKLIVHGFKSFKDRTTINFDKGITGIVGPNGCGKSNIVDALFWVMGEQSAKHLRGSSMKDVIFSGSDKYSPGAWAEVVLILDNNAGKHIHIGNKVASPSEIQISRKLYRNGETEYRINDVPCRLRDIQEVFMDTGAGAKSYSIIAQGEINKLVQAKPEERRVMIEEVAGVTKFKIRKRDSLKKIEQTNENLIRLNDLKIEIEKNLKVLEKQAEKASSARVLKEKIEKNELIVSSHKELDLFTRFTNSKEVLSELNTSLEKWKSRKDVLEIGLEDEKFKRDEETEKLDYLQREYNELSRELAAKEERLGHVLNNKKEKEKLIEMRQKESVDLQDELNGRKNKLSELEKEKESVEMFNPEVMDFSDLEERVVLLESELENRNDELGQITEEIDELTNEKSELDRELFRATSKLEEITRNVEDITKESDTLENQYSSISNEIKNEKLAVEKFEIEVQQLTTKESSEKISLREKEDKLKNVKHEYDKSVSDLIKVESKCDSLREINSALEGAGAGAQKFVSQDSSGIRLFGSLIKCERQYLGGVQNILKEFLDCVLLSAAKNANGDIVNENEVFDSFVSWIKSNSQDTINAFMPITSTESIQNESIERLSLWGLKGIVPLGSVLRFDEDIDSAFKNISFDGFYLSENFNPEHFERFKGNLNFKAIASYDGHYVIKNFDWGKSISQINTSDEANGMVARNNKIEELEREIVEKIQLKNSLELQRESLEKDCELQKDSYESLRTSLSDIKARYEVQKSSLELKLKNFETSAKRLDVLRARKSDLSKQRIDFLEKEEGLSKRLNELNIQLDDLQSNAENLEENISLLKDEYDLKKEELLEKKMEVKRYEERKKSIFSQIEDIEGQLVKMNQRIENNTQLVDSYQEEIINLTNETEQLTDENQSLADNLSNREAVLSELKDQLADLLHGMQARENEVRDLAREINGAEKQVVELELKREQILEEEEQLVRNIFEKYQIDLRDVIRNHLELPVISVQDFKDVSGMFLIESSEGDVRKIDRKEYLFVRRYGKDLDEVQRNLSNAKREYAALGEINWQAIEDYDRQKLRFDFLNEQEIELRKSVTDLEEAIAQIDAKSRERFKMAFNEVNMRFEKIFPIIFGGGDAHLKIIGDLDDIECGVDIIARPPGKKMQNINLMSGGEKAMTAVSLIFSIYLVKPAPFCLLDEVDAPLDDANIGRFNELLREMSSDSQFILITHNKKTMEMNDTLYGVTMQEPGISKAVSVQLH